MELSVIEMGERRYVTQRLVGGTLTAELPGTKGIGANGTPSWPSLRAGTKGIGASGGPTALHKELEPKG